MSELKLKKLLVGSGAVGAIILVGTVVGICLNIPTESDKIRHTQQIDRSNLRQCLLAILVYKTDENRYPARLLDLYPDYIDSKRIFKSPKALTQQSEAYIYLPPAPDSIPPKTIILVSPIIYPRGKCVVGFADGSVGIVDDQDLPSPKNHSPAN